jgi:hypothetical protein
MKILEIVIAATHDDLTAQSSGKAGFVINPCFLAREVCDNEFSESDLT